MPSFAIFATPIPTFIKPLDLFFLQLDMSCSRHKRKIFVFVFICMCLYNLYTLGEGFFFYGYLFIKPSYRWVNLTICYDGFPWWDLQDNLHPREDDSSSAWRFTTSVSDGTGAGFNSAFNIYMGQVTCLPAWRRSSPVSTRRWAPHDINFRTLATEMLALL